MKRRCVLLLLVFIAIMWSYSQANVSQFVKTSSTYIDLSKSTLSSTKEGTIDTATQATTDIIIKTTTDDLIKTTTNTVTQMNTGLVTQPSIDNVTQGSTLGDRPVNTTINAETTISYTYGDTIAIETGEDMTTIANISTKPSTLTITAKESLVCFRTCPCSLTAVATETLQDMNAEILKSILKFKESRRLTRNTDDRPTSKGMAAVSVLFITGAFAAIFLSDVDVLLKHLLAAYKNVVNVT